MNSLRVNISYQEKLEYIVRKGRDFSIVIDEKLEFDKHINEKINKANSVIDIKGKHFKYLHERNSFYLFKALLRPH